MLLQLSSDPWRNSDWWIPGTRELSGLLLISWFIVMLGVLGLAIYTLVQLWRGERSGQIHWQEYRWRISERFQFYGGVLITGWLSIPMLFAICSVLMLAVIRIFGSAEVAGNVVVLGSIIFWTGAYFWLLRKLRKGRVEPALPSVVRRN